MLISVVIPTCNRNDLLSKCLDLLAPENQTIEDNYEIIVTDDSKDNITKNVIGESHPWVKWIAGPQKGPAANRNNGAKNTKGEWLVFIDDDCLPDKNILNTYKNAIEKHPESLAFEGAIIPDNWSLMKNEMAECPINTDGNCFWSANICVQKQLFMNINGFDELFLIAAQEDQDIFERLKKHTNIPFLKGSVVTHPVRFGSVKKKIKGMKMQFANWIYYMQKNSDMGVRKHLLKSVRDYIKMSVKNILNFKFRLLILNSLKALYCAYLFVTYKKLKPNS